MSSTEISSSTASQTGPLKQAYDFYSDTVCELLAVPNKLFKVVANGVPLIALVAPVGSRTSKLALLMGRVRPVFYAALMGKYAPKLWRKDGIRKDLFDRERRNIAKAGFTLSFLVFQATFTTRGVLDLLTQFRALKKLEGALKAVNRVIPSIVLVVDLLGAAVTIKSILDRRGAEERKRELEAQAFGLADDACDTLATALEPGVVEFEGVGPIASAFGTLSGAFGLVATLRDISEI